MLLTLSLLQMPVGHSSIPPLLNVVFQEDAPKHPGPSICHRWDQTQSLATGSATGLSQYLAMPHLTYASLRRPSIFHCDLDSKIRTPGIIYIY